VILYDLVAFWLDLQALHVTFVACTWSHVTNSTNLTNSWVSWVKNSWVKILLRLKLNSNSTLLTHELIEFIEFLFLTLTGFSICKGVALSGGFARGWILYFHPGICWHRRTSASITSACHMIAIKFWKPTPTHSFKLNISTLG
jgi:hypothetical protein